MYGTIHMCGTVYVTVHDTVHIDGSMMWHWPMMWHWLMRCHNPIGLKFLCTVDQWRGMDQKSRVRYMHYTGLFSTKPRHCSIRVKPCYCSPTWSNRVLLTDDVVQSWASKLFLIRWPWFTQCIYKNGASPLPLIGYLWIHFWTPFSVISSPSCIFYVFSMYFNKFPFCS